MINQRVNGKLEALNQVLATLRDFPSARLDPVYRALIELHLRHAAYEINEAIMYIEMEGKETVEPRKRVCL